jgi:hypothetical protein
MESDLETEEAKELELDERSKPTRKISHPNVPVPDVAEPSTMDRKKGRRKIKKWVKKSGFNTSKADLSSGILDITDKPDVAVWNKTIRRRNIGSNGRQKMGPLNQNLIREDTNITIDSANRKDISDIVISRTKVTDKIDLSKSKSNRRL